jgi:hypothetical protein
MSGAAVQDADQTVTDRAESLVVCLSAAAVVVVEAAHAR